MTWSDDQGNSCSRNGDCIDISSSGLRIKSDTQIPARTVVTLRSKALALHGSASVRRCSTTGVKYVLGLEFVGVMKWQAPESLVPTGSQ